MRLFLSSHLVPNSLRAIDPKSFQLQHLGVHVRKYIYHHGNNFLKSENFCMDIVDGGSGIDQLKSFLLLETKWFMIGSCKTIATRQAVASWIHQSIHISRATSSVYQNL